MQHLCLRMTLLSVPVFCVSAALFPLSLSFFFSFLFILAPDPTRQKATS